MARELKRERMRELRRDAEMLVWRTLDRFGQIPTPEEVKRATDKIVSAFAFLQRANPSSQETK